MRKILIAGMLGLIIIGAAGGYYRYASEKLDTISRLPLFPPVPLENFPMALGSWQGREVPISDTVLKVAGVDDYLSRFYVNTEFNTGGVLYVGYTAEPRRMLGHRPEVCYVGSGWIHDRTWPETIRTRKGDDIEVLLHRFYKIGLAYEEVFVLNYYVVNGQLTTDHRIFDGIRWRRPKEAGGRLQYVAQVQVSSSSEQAVRLLAQDIADMMMRYMP